MKTLPLSEIRIDGGTQPRVEISVTLVSEYAEVMKAGEKLPPVVVFFDGVDNWLADGFHRYHAAQQAGLDSLPVEIHKGTKRDAVLYSVGANADHGQRRTIADKRRAVLILLNDEEWSAHPTNWFAVTAHVSWEFAEKIRLEVLSSRGEKMPNSRAVTRGDSTYTMDTTNIGRASRPKGFGSIAKDAHQPTYQPPPMTPKTAFEFPQDPAIVAAALFERFGADFALALIDQLNALLGRES